MLDEIGQGAFWRVTFDNLDFKTAFSKTLHEGSLKRMLHLITGQISHAADLKRYAVCDVLAAGNETVRSCNVGDLTEQFYVDLSESQRKLTYEPAWWLCPGHSRYIGLHAL